MAYVPIEIPDAEYGRLQAFQNDLQALQPVPMEDGSQGLPDPAAVQSVYRQYGFDPNYAATFPIGATDPYDYRSYVRHPQTGRYTVVPNPGQLGLPPAHGDFRYHWDPQRWTYRLVNEGSGLPFGLSDAGFAGLAGGTVLAAGVGGGLLAGGAAAGAGAGAGAGAAGAAGLDIVPGAAGAAIDTGVGAGVGAGAGAGAEAGAGGVAGLDITAGTAGPVIDSGAVAANAAKAGLSLKDYIRLAGLVSTAGGYIAQVAGGGGGGAAGGGSADNEAIFQRLRNLAGASIPQQEAKFLEATTGATQRANGSLQDAITGLRTQLSGLRDHLTQRFHTASSALGSAGGGQTARAQGEALSDAGSQLQTLFQRYAAGGHADLASLLGNLRPSEVTQLPQPVSTVGPADFSGLSKSLQGFDELAKTLDTPRSRE